MKPNRTQPYSLASSLERKEIRPGCGNGGFTAIELAAVMVMLALLTLAFVPTLAKNQTNTKAIRCQNNLRQLAAAWNTYAADYSERVANDFGVSETLGTIQQGGFENWINNVMTWGATAATSDLSNTNVAWVTNSAFGRYLGGAVDAYRCPSDKYLSPVQRAAGWTTRLRSVSMNSVFGRFSTGLDSTVNGLNWAFPQYVQYLKQTSVRKPAKTWVFIEEHPDSINDGYFVNNPSASNWQDIPGSFHNGGCSISFADGHACLKRWQSPTSWYSVQFSYPATKSFDSSGRTDFAWYLSRVGYVDAKTGHPAFGY